MAAKSASVRISRAEGRPLTVLADFMTRGQERADCDRFHQGGRTPRSHRNAQ